MQITIQNIYAYDSVDDREIIARYQSDPQEIYVAVLLFRYEFLIYKIISQWHTKNQHIEFNDSDYLDMRHVGYQALTYMMSRVDNPHSIKNVGSRLQKYVINAINKEYKHRRYESVFDTELHPASSMKTTDFEDTFLKSEINVKELITDSLLLHLIFFKKYSYYKIGLMMFGTNNLHTMQKQISHHKRRLLNQIRVKLGIPTR